MAQSEECQKKINDGWIRLNKKNSFIDDCKRFNFTKDEANEHAENFFMEIIEDLQKTIAKLNQ